MKREIEVKLEAIEEIIATQREACCKNLAETIRRLKEQHPMEFGEILRRIHELLAKYKVNCDAYFNEH